MALESDIPDLESVTSEFTSQLFQVSNFFSERLTLLSHSLFLWNGAKCSWRIMVMRLEEINKMMPYGIQLAVHLSVFHTY